MSDQSPNDNWQLEENEKNGDKWVLEESEQRVTDRWQLEDAQTPDEVNSWQPVEYVKPPRPAGAWILPTIITLALVIVIGYTAFRVLPGLLNPDDGVSPPLVEGTETPVGDENTPSDVVAVNTPTEGEPTPETDNSGTNPPPANGQETEPTAIPVEEEPTPTATLNTNVEVEFGVVNPEFGLNARVAPDADAEIIRILEQNESLLVFSQQGDWLEVFVNETPLNEGEPIAGQIGFVAAEFMGLTSQELSAQLYNEILEYAGKQPTPTPVPPTPEPDVVDESPAGGDDVTVTVNANNGVFVRTAPDATTDENVVRLLENDTVITAIARTEDNEWVIVELPDGVTGWTAVQFIVLNDDITTLPIVDPTVALPTVDGSESAPVDGTTVITTGIAVAEPYSNILPDDDVPAVIVEIVEGVNARTSPDLEANIEALVPQGAVLPALGRSDDNQWVQVQLPIGIQAWIFRTTITETPAVGALPAVLTELPTPAPVEPGEQILIPTPTPGAAPEDTEAETGNVTARVLPFVLPVYAEPNSDGDPLLRAARGTNFTVIGRTEGGEWLQVELSTGVIGWVVAGNVDVSGDLSTVSVAP